MASTVRTVMGDIWPQTAASVTRKLLGWVDGHYWCKADGVVDGHHWCKVDSHHWWKVDGHHWCKVGGHLWCKADGVVDGHHWCIVYGIQSCTAVSYGLLWKFFPLVPLESLGHTLIHYSKSSISYPRQKLLCFSFEMWESLYRNILIGLCVDLIKLLDDYSKDGEL